MSFRRNSTNMPKRTTDEGLVLAEELKYDVVKFTRHFLKEPDGTPAEPHAGQIEMLSNIEPTTVIAAGRQWGKSHSLGWYVAWFIVTHTHRNVFIIAPTLDQSRIIFNEVVQHFRRYPLNLLLKGKPKEYPFPELKLTNGCEVHARGANSPQYIRGNRAHLIILDEAAFFRDKVITDTIEPMLTVTGKEQDSALIMISTPFGRGAFYEYARDAMRGDAGMRFHHFSSLSNPHADMQRLERIMARYGQDSFLWKTEYLAEFEDDDGAVFPWKDIEWAYEHYPYVSPEGWVEFPRAPEPGHTYVQGADLANARDYFVSAVLDTTRPASVLVRYDRFRRRGYGAAKETIRSNWREYFEPKTLVDATSLGESVVEDLYDIRAEGFKFSEQSKYALIQELVRAFNEHRLLIPQDRTLLDEIRYFQYQITANRKVKIEASKGHDDTVIGLALANHLAYQPRGQVIFLGVLSPDQTVNPFYRRPKSLSAGEYYDPYKEAFRMD